MNKLGIIAAIVAVALYGFKGEILRLYRYHQIDKKFEQTPPVAMASAHADQTAYTPQDDPTIMNEVWEDEHGLMHGAGKFNNDIDPKVLAKARMQMDSSDKPVKVVWEMLKDVKFKKKFNKDYDQYFDYPVFGAKLRALEGKKITVSGYIIPLDVGMYALSKNPYAACFFCGGAGPETIMALVFSKAPRRYKTDDFITLQGVFKLNEANVDQFMYQLVAADEEM
jgi:hypothetical protein